MGLSRNKVAVSEGAAGSPPFYGELNKRNRICYNENFNEILCCQETDRADSKIEFKTKDDEIR